MALVEFDLAGSNQQKVFVEVDEPRGMVRASGAGDLLKSPQTFQKAIEAMRPVAASIIETVKELAPRGMEVEFGFKLTGEGNCVLVKGSAEAHVVVRLMWGEALPD